MKQLMTLTIGQKYTVVKFGEMGFIFALQITLMESKITPYAQYQETVVLAFKQKGKRNIRQIRIFERDDYLVYEGWVSVNTEMYVEQLSDGCKRSLLSFDREYLQIAKRSVANAPLLERLTPCSNADTAAIREGRI